MPNLTFADLAAGLEKFGDRYTALDVFIHDVQDLDCVLAGKDVPGLELIEGIGAGSFSFSSGEKQYRLTVFQDHGVVRVTREPGVRTETMMGAAIGTAMGGAMGAAGAVVASRPQSQEIATLAGMALGLLIGGVIGATVADSNAPRRIFALRFDPDTKQWRAYDGGLIRWMKERLADPSLG